VWPVSFAVEMTTVLLVTLTMLFLPKLLALLLLLERQPAASHVTVECSRATLSVVLETVFSVLTAPVLMLFQTKFVLAILMRRAVGWPTAAAWRSHDQLQAKRRWRTAGIP
jgi:membrane glycosyltransferase